MHELSPMLCAHTLITQVQYKTVSPAPGAVGLMIMKAGKAGYALSAQGQVTLHGAKNKHLWSARVAVRRAPVSSYMLGRTSKRLLIPF